MNPNREEIIPYKIPPMLPVIAVLTSIPNIKEAYHEERFEILKASLQMARNNAGMEHHFMIWDNGSCDKVTKWLYYFAPDQLILSKNIGVMNAMYRIFWMYHDCIIAYSNDDILYYKNWLPEQVHILMQFPNVATVSGCVTKYYTGKADEHTHEWAKANGQLFGIETPLEWDIQHGESIGKKEQHTREVYHGKVCPAVHYGMNRAIIGGNHCQFVSKARVILPFLRITTRYMEPLFQALDMRINEADLLRFMTTTRRTRHLGNVLTDADRKEINELVGSVSP